MSEEHKAKISEKLKGRVFSDKHKAKLSGHTPYNKGCVMQDEQKRKIAIANKNKPKSEEHRNKLSKARAGSVFSNEHKAKLSESKKGRIWINNGIIIKHVYEKEVETFILNGFKIGKSIRKFKED